MLTFHKSLIFRIYRKCFAPLGCFKLKRLYNRGLPEQMLRTLSFLFKNSLSDEDKKVFYRVESIREKIADSGTLYAPIMMNHNLQRTASEIAMESSVTPEWGMFLYRCAKSFQARTVLELGSSAGVSGCYLASAPSCRNFITIEGSPALAALAEHNIRQINSQSRVINGRFEEVLGNVLDNLTEQIDLVYIDGPKTQAETLHLFRLIIPKLSSGGIVIFDDIMWSRDMWQLWKVVCDWEGIAYAINIGRFGVCLWRGNKTQPVKVDLSFFTGWLRIKK
jgi:predicted O-methyltransferase YrrM